MNLSTSTYYSKITRCNLCQHNLVKRLDFGVTALANAYVQPSSTDPDLASPLTVMQCEKCGSVQLEHVVNPEVLYKNYLYASSTSASFRQHFQDYAENMRGLLRPEPGDLACEIGSNDGILLRPLQQKGFTVIGVEPATRFAEAANAEGLTTICKFFDDETANDIIAQYGRCKLVTANNVFAHILNINTVVAAVSQLLLDEGIFVFEVAYLMDTIKNLYFDQVYAEHLFYHSLKPLMALFDKFGMEIFNVKRQPIQGGSIRCYVQHKKTGRFPISTSVDQLLAEEDFLYQDATYEEYNRRIARLKDALHKTLDTYPSISAFGVPAKFTTFCKVMDIAHLIDFTIDDSPLKQGLLTPGSRIPIGPRSWLQEKHSDACLVTAWNFAPDIISTNKYTGKWIVPLPTVQEIDGLPAIS